MQRAGREWHFGIVLDLGTSGPDRIARLNRLAPGPPMADQALTRHMVNAVREGGIVDGNQTSGQDARRQTRGARYGMNGEFLARLELPPPVASDVLAATDFLQGKVVEGREIAFTNFAVWEAPTDAALTIATGSHPHTPRGAMGSTGTARAAGPGSQTPLVAWSRQESPLMHGRWWIADCMSIRVSLPC